MSLQSISMLYAVMSLIYGLAMGFVATKYLHDARGLRWAVIMIALVVAAYALEFDWTFLFYVLIGAVIGERLARRMLA